jgi:hypothetical protein
LGIYYAPLGLVGLILHQRLAVLVEVLHVGVYVLHPLIELRAALLEDDIITIVTLLACILKHVVSLLLFEHLLLEDVVVVFDNLLCKLVSRVILSLFFLFLVLGRFLF